MFFHHQWYHQSSSIGMYVFRIINTVFLYEYFNDVLHLKPLIFVYLWGDNFRSANLVGATLPLNSIFLSLLLFDFHIPFVGKDLDKIIGNFSLVELMDSEYLTQTHGCNLKVT